MGERPQTATPHKELLQLRDAGSWRESLHPEKSTPIGYPSPENRHSSSIIQTEHDAFMYLGIYTLYKYIFPEQQLMKKWVINLKGNKEGSMGMLEGKETERRIM